jgi:hypothetical protein
MASSSTSEVAKPASETAVVPASAHAPSLAGSVIEAKDGMGGSNFIRIQNMSATGMPTGFSVVVVRRFAELVGRSDRIDSNQSNHRLRPFADALCDGDAACSFLLG